MDGEIWPALLRIRVESLRDAFAQIETELEAMDHPDANKVKLQAHVHTDELDTLRDIFLHTKVPDPSSLKLINQQLVVLKDHYHKIMRKWVRLVSHSERIKRKLAA